MDNKINQIRKQISILRAEMLETERVMRGQVARDSSAARLRTCSSRSGLNWSA
jgi:hypothetical protein